MPASSSPWPWGLIGALVLLGAAEVGLRLHRPDGDISYRMSEQEYRFLPLELRRFGSASVVVIGSSRAREGVSIPVLRDKSAEPGSSRTYASYAIAAGRASETLLVAHHLVHAEPRPDLVLYGVEPRQLLSKGESLAAQRFMMLPRDWLRLRRQRGAWVDSTFGHSLRNALAGSLWLFRYEHVFREAAHRTRGGRWAELRKTLGKSSRLDRTPVRGLPTIWHLESPRKAGKSSTRQARRYLKRVTKGKPYTLDRDQFDRMRETVRVLQQAGVDVVLYEQPASAGLQAALPKTVMPEYHALMEELGDEFGVPYWTAEEMGIELRDRDWREHSHLNLRGATKVASALAESIVTPWLLEQR